MKKKSPLKLVHRQDDVSDISQKEIYHQLSQVKEDLESIITLLDQELNLLLDYHPIYKTKRRH